MPKILLLSLAVALCLPAALAANPAHPDEVELSYYLPEGTAYDPGVPTPESVLGFAVGQWHVRPDQLLAYVERLAASSDRARLEELGRTNEHRRQVLLVVSSPANLARLPAILERHRALSEAPAPATDGLDSEPVVVYLGYSIHGNEASGSNASMLVAYHLAAGRSAEVAEMLDNAVILIDPSLNPDGLGRFAQWANMYRGMQPVADPANREHQEEWPGGRTNHYWVDLNRDWLLLQQPESRNRVRAFQHWRPNVLADFHEMGSASTYFFQPGVPSRQNPLTPAENLDLTREIAGFHAAALDAAGSLYFTEETFDDFYYGKGSTYPDIQGAVGILFEQASARGHMQEGEQGLLTFPFAIRNHFLTSLSTLRGAVANRRELLDYQRRFYRDARAEAERDPTVAYLVGDPADAARAAELAAVLRAHGIEVFALARPIEQGGVRFTPGSAYVVPTRQRQYRLLTSLFERRTEFPDSTFYDVSAWTLPLAYGLPWAELGAGDRVAELTGARIEGAAVPPGRVPPSLAPGGGGAAEPVAYAFEWSGYYAPRALGRLLAAGAPARVATRPFDAGAEDDRRHFGYGTIVVPLGPARELAERGRGPDVARIREILATAAREDGVDVHALATGLTAGGVDLGSPSLEPLMPPRPMLVVGHHTASSEAGEIWNLLDRRLGLELSLIDKESLGQVDLEPYTHVILVSGRYEELAEGTVKRLASWIRGGGTLIATQAGAVWTETAILGLGGEGTDGGGSAGGEGDEPEPPLAPRPYAEYSTDLAQRLVAGTIFEAALDLTHPLAYGYTRERLPVFRDTTLTLRPSDDPYATPVRYTEDPLLAGFVSAENLAALAGAPAVIATRLGRGVVIRMIDNPSFRGAWYGTDRLLSNALFFGPVIDSTLLPPGVTPPGE